MKWRRKWWKEKWQRKTLKTDGKKNVQYRQPSNSWAIYTLLSVLKKSRSCTWHNLCVIKHLCLRKIATNHIHKYSNGTAQRGRNASILKSFRSYYVGVGTPYKGQDLILISRYHMFLLSVQGLDNYLRIIVLHTAHDYSLEVKYKVG